jgi:DNA processing protein
VLGVGSAGAGGAADGGPPTVSAGLSERDAWVVVASVKGIGPVGFAALLRSFGSARAILDAALRPGAVSSLVAGGRNNGRLTFDSAVAGELLARAADPRPPLAEIEASGVRVITLDDADYPERLRAIEIPPPILFVRGSVEALSMQHAVAVVGTRRATERGRLVASRIGVSIASTGACVVSGLAYGIDGAAQDAVAQAGFVTVAVLGSGHDRLYPRAHGRLADRIAAAGGAIVSEFSPLTPPRGDTFPRRNRLISGLSDATVVVEAGERSGALITAGWALEQGRECFVVPGPLDAPRSAGCLAWLRDMHGQARVVAGIPQLIEDLGLLREVAPKGARARRPSVDAELIELGGTARAIAIELLRGRGTIDEIVGATGLPVATALGGLTLLEMRGLATSTYGRYRAAGSLASADPASVPAA